jgi:hypothetical protein
MGVECDIDELTHQAWMLFKKAMEDIEGWTIVPGHPYFGHPCFEYKPLKMELFLCPSYDRNKEWVEILIDGVSFDGFANKQKKKAADFFRTLQDEQIKKLKERQCKKMQEALAGVKVLGVVSESTPSPAEQDTSRIPWYKRWFN